MESTAEFSDGMKQTRCQRQQRMAKFKQGQTQANGANAGQEVTQSVKLFPGFETSLPGAMVDFTAGEEDRRRRGHCDCRKIACQIVAYGGRRACPWKVVEIVGYEHLRRNP